MNPSTTRILAIRHGETAWNKATRIQGHIDIALNEAGLRQAAALVPALHDESITTIYTSDLSRAQATAAPLAQAKGLVVCSEAALRERHFGVWEGQTYADIAIQHPAEYGRWRDREPDFAVEGAENLRLFEARITGIFTALARRHAGQTIAVFTHGGCLDIVYRLANDVALTAPRTWSISNAVVNRLLFDGQRFHCEVWGQSDHLDTLEV